jgi:iron complex outermembrane receptor protein
MRLNYLVLSLIIILFSTSTSIAKDLMDPVIVTATKIKTKDTKATYASEVYNRKDIEQSGTKSLYDFLNQSTSIVTMPSSGNVFSQKIDMRGFGLTDGYKNIVVTINGRRLNNVDSVPQKLSEISINNIERIEITKGSGSVVHGDGATGGSIQIYTRDTTETTLEGSLGNYGISTGSFTTGHSDGKFILSASGDTYHQDGFSDKDPYGDRDSGTSGNYSTKLRYFPTEASEVFIEKDHANVNIRYPNYLDQVTYEQNPGSNDKGGGNGPTRYNFQTSNTNNLTLGGTLELSNNLEASFTFTHQDKVTVMGTEKKYHTNAIDSSIKYENGPLKFITGIQTWDGIRNADTWDKKGTDTAKKSNFGLFAQSSYDTGSTVFSLGMRGEWVEYSWETEAKDYGFLAYDLGINKTLSDHLSIFSNLNYAFLAPDVDRLFTGVGAFNGFLDPAMTTTLNIGVNYVASKNKMKLALYGMTLKNELYYSKTDRGTGVMSNTNLDSSYKYGFEVYDQYSFNNNLSANINYAYTKAMIDYEPATGDELPQVSEHTVSLGVNYNPTSKSRITLGNIYRSKMLMEEDFDNANAKNNAYNSTNLSYTYSYKTDSGKGLFNWWQSGPRQADISLKVDNLFERSHGSWLRNDVIYPYQFTRNWRIGTKLLF